MSTDTSKKSGFSEFVNAKILPPILNFVNNDPHRRYIVNLVDCFALFQHLFIDPETGSG